MPTRSDGGFSSPPKKKKRPPPPAPISERAMDARVTRRGPPPAVKQATIQATKFGVVKPWEVPPPRAPSRPRPQPPLAHPTFIEALRPTRPGFTPAPTSRSAVFYTPPSSRPPTSKQQRKQQDRLYDLALQAPVSGAARRKVARSMSDEERRQYHERLRPPAPPPPLHTLGPSYVPFTRSIPALTHWLGSQGPLGRDVNTVLSGIPAIAASFGPAVAKDVYDFALQKPGVPFKRSLRLGGEMAVGEAKSIYKTTGSPTLDPLEALARGDFHEYVRLRKAQEGRSAAQFREHPLLSALDVAAAVAIPLRGASIGALTRSIARANPEFSAARVLNLARRESYRPGHLASRGIEGGIEPRVLRARVEGGGERATVAKPLASTPLGRAAQRAYDAHSARIDPNRTLVGRFSEQKRAVRQMGKRDAEAVERAQLLVQQTSREIARYVRGTRRERVAGFLGTDLGKQRARAAGLVYALQGPEHEAARTTLRAVREDLQTILDTGGKEIPTKARIRVEKRIDKLDQELDRLGLGVDENAPLWVELRNTLHGAGLAADQIDTIVQSEKHFARVWAKEQPGRDPSDYLASPEGRNMGEFLNVLPEDGVAGVLFQRPGWNPDLVGRAKAEDVQPGDALYDPIDGQGLHVEAKHGTDLVVRSDTSQTTHTLSPRNTQELVHQTRRPGDRVVNVDGEVAKIVSVDADRGIVNVVDSNGTHGSWTSQEVAPPGPTYFYSALERTVLDPKFQNKVAPDQLLGMLKKNVKEAELTWSGIEEWVTLLKESDVKSVSKQEIIDWLHNDSDFTLQEVYLEQGAIRHGSAYGTEAYSSRPGDPGYREIVINMGPLPQTKPYTHGHWGGYGSAPSIQNPVAHIRFVLDEETKTIYVNEFQSDWHKQILHEGTNRPPRVTDPEWDATVRGIDEQTAALSKEGQERSAQLLGTSTQGLGDAWPAEVMMAQLKESVNDTVRLRHEAVPEESRPSFAELRNAQQTALEELYALPEWHRLLKVAKIEARYKRRIQRLTQIRWDLSSAVAAAPFSGGAWRTLVLKRAIAEAVAQGYDKVAWDAGVVHNVRYQVTDPYEELGVNRGYNDYGDYSDAPSPPDHDEYSYLNTSAEMTFAPPVFPTHEQMHLFGGGSAIDSGAMDETYPLDFYDDHYSREDLVPGMMVIPDYGPLQGQLVSILSEDENGFRLRPTGATRVRFDGRADSPDSSYGEIEQSWEYQHQPDPVDPYGGQLPAAPRTRTYDSAYGYVNEPSQHLGSDYLLPESRGADLDSQARQSEDYVLDDDAYGQAQSDYEDRLAEFEAEQASGEIDPEDINRLSAEGTPHGKLYDEIFPNDANKLLKKYKYPSGDRVRVMEGRRRGRYAIEGGNLESGEGQVKVYEFQITPEMADDVRKGQALFQRQEGEPVGAAWLQGEQGRRSVALLQDADVSTWLHEMIGHGTDELSRRFPEEWAGVERSMKKPLDQWGEKEQERFARWTERYFREGKAPTPEAAPLLAQMKDWLRQVYQSILALGRPIPQEARDLLDRYLGKQGEGSVFNEREQGVLQEHGELLGRRQELVKQERDRLLAQPDADLLDQAHTLMAEGEPDEQQAAYSEIGKRRKGKEGRAKPSEEQRLLQRQVKLLDDAIRSAGDPESGFTDALAALTTLSEDADRLFRETILEMAPEDARPGMEAALAKRRNLLVNRWREKGLLPYGTGDALGYFPHASLFESLGDQLKGPVRQSQGSRRVIGKTQVSKTAARKGDNLLRRYQSGTLNLDPKVLLNTVNARLRLLQTREARDVLWEMGRPVKSEADVEPGWWVINREGKHVPERLRRAQEMSPEQMDEMVAAGEDFDSNLETREGMDNLLTDYASSFARPADQVPNDWWGAGELRAVPPEIVDGLLPKPFQSKPGGALATTTGLLNAAARVATILQYPVGYILSNVPANLIMQSVTHPSALIRDNPRALALRRRNPDLYHQLAQAAGDIMAGAGIPDFYARAQKRGERVERGITRAQKGLAQRYGEVADTPFRVGTLMGYARRYGVKTDEQLAAMVKGEGKLGVLRDALGQRTRDDLIDFNTLTQAEKETVSRYFFLWPLVRGMAKWPVTFARDHPIAAATIAQAGRDEFQRQSEYGKLGTASQRAARHLSIVPIGGKHAIDLTSVNPFGGLENIQSLLSAPEKLSRGDLGGVRDAVAGMTIPQIRELFRNQPDARALLESTVPGSKYLTSSLGKSRGSKIWKRENWWNYMLERNVRFLPEEVDAAMMRSQADRERRAQTGTTAHEERTDAEYAALPRILKRAGVIEPGEIKEIHNGFEAYDYVSSRTSDLDAAGRVTLVNDAIHKFYPQYVADLKQASEMSEAEQKRYYERVRNLIYATHRRVIGVGEKMGLLEG